MSEVSFRDWMKERQAHFESVAEAGIPGSDVFPQGLHEAMRWSILEGGKRVRPLLCYAASAITRAKPEAADAAALSLECIHSYSLVHDDLPCMDNDLLRHGKASTHAKFGFAEAVLAGDALQAEAFRLSRGQQCALRGFSRRRPDPAACAAVRRTICRLPEAGMPRSRLRICGGFTR